MNTRNVDRSEASVTIAERAKRKVTSKPQEASPQLTDQSHEVTGTKRKAAAKATTQAIKFSKVIDPREEQGDEGRTQRCRLVVRKFLHECWLDRC